MTITPDAPTVAPAADPLASLDLAAVQDLSVTTFVPELLAALKFTASGIGSRLPIAVLHGALLEVADGQLTVTRFDYERCNRETIPGVGTGRALVPAATLRELVSGLDKSPVSLAVEKQHLVITQDDLRYTVPLLKIADFPALPPAGDDILATLTGAEFYRTLLATTVARGTADTLPQLTGIRVETSSGQMVLVCTDRYRLSLFETGIPASTMPDLLLPGAHVEDAAKQFKKADDVQICVHWTQDEPTIDYVTVNDGSRSITVRPIDGDFPKYRALLPDAFLASLVLDTATASRAVTQVAKVAKLAARNSPVVRFDLQPNTLTLLAGGADDVQASKRLTGEFDGEPLTIAANPDYLLDGIKAVGGEQVRLQFTQPTRPFVISAETMPGFIYLQMPVRLR